MKIQEYIEDALKDLIEARTYITTNSINVAVMDDGTEKKGSPFVEINAESLERQSNNHDNYYVETTLQAVSNAQEDLSSTAIKALYADLSDFAYYDLTAAALQGAIDAIDASSGILIGGFDYMTSDTKVPEQHRYKELLLNIALVYTPA